MFVGPCPQKFRPRRPGLAKSAGRVHYSAPAPDTDP
jgi:hypothetical protein